MAAALLDSAALEYRAGRVEAALASALSALCTSDDAGLSPAVKTRAHLTVSACTARLGRCEESLQAARAALEIGGDSAKAHFRAAVASVALEGKEEDAVKHAKAAVALAPGDAKAADLLAKAKKVAEGAAARQLAEVRERERAQRDAMAEQWRAAAADDAAAAAALAQAADEEARAARIDEEAKRREEREAERAERAAFIRRQREAATERDEAAADRVRRAHERTARTAHHAANLTADAEDAKDTRDHYAVLGVSHNATTREVRKAYLKQAAVAHPDRGGTDAAFERLQEAYRVLGSAYERAAYDDALEIARGRSGNNTATATESHSSAQHAGAMPAEAWTDAAGATAASRAASSRAREAFAEKEFHRAAELFTEALRCARAAIALGGAPASRAPLLLNRSLARFKSGDATGALDDAREAVACGGGAVARRRVAECLVHLGRGDEVDDA